MRLRHLGRGSTGNLGRLGKVQSSSRDPPRPTIANESARKSEMLHDSVDEKPGHAARQVALSLLLGLAAWIVRHVGNRGKEKSQAAAGRGAGEDVEVSKVTADLFERLGQRYDRGELKIVGRYTAGEWRTATDSLQRPGGTVGPGQNQAAP